MPQLILEYTSNIMEKQDLNGLFKTLHETLAEKLPTDIESCKSRAIEQAKYYIGDGNSNNAFVNLHIKVMDGRSMEKLSEVGNWVMEILKNPFLGITKTTEFANYFTASRITKKSIF